MAYEISATFEDGVFKPDEPLDLAPHTRAKIVLEVPHEPSQVVKQAILDIEQLWNEYPVKLGKPRPTRDDLYDRH